MLCEIHFTMIYIFYFLEKMAAVVDNLAKNKRHFFSRSQKRPSFWSKFFYMLIWNLRKNTLICREVQPLFITVDPLRWALFPFLFLFLPDLRESKFVFFCGLECVGHSFVCVAHFWEMTVLELRQLPQQQARYQLKPPSSLVSHPIYSLATQLLCLATHIFT